MCAHGRGGQGRAMLASLTGARRRDEIDPRGDLTRLLTGLADTAVRWLDRWLADEGKRRVRTLPVLAPFG